MLKSLLRRVLVSATLASLFLLVPAYSATKPQRGSVSRPAPFRAPTTLVSFLSEIWKAATDATDDVSVRIDPNGNSVSVRIDPNGVDTRASSANGGR